MATRSVATVFGGSGFIGRYVVKRLAHKGFVVRVAVRDPEAALFLKTAGGVGQIVPLFANVTDEATVRRAVSGADLVVNLVGLLAERRKGDFHTIHVEGAGLVARQAAAAGVERLIHVSAIGADPASPSLYAQTKAAGEDAVRDAFTEATILRPSVVFGPEDKFFNRFASLARLSLILPVFAGESRLQPVYVGDVADAILAALASSDAAGTTYELGGPRVWRFRDLLAYIVTETGRRRWMPGMPGWLANLQAAILERLPGQLLTRDQLLMLSRDNVVTAGMPELGDFGIVPTPVELVVPGYLRRFQPGGGRRPVLPGDQPGGPTDLSFQVRDAG
jgi:NADH dehydrogenase